jgi:hypothetical protein
LPVDRVPAVAEPGTDQENVLRRLGSQPPQAGRHHGGGVAPEHPPVGDVSGIASVAADGLRSDQQVVVVVLDGDDPRSTAPADFYGPGGSEGAHGCVDEEL